ncbi:ribonuclease E inhibitor RraB [Paenibacillus xanthanilyticus]|uniref:Ribonuclease E inhibitor RraB n=1 Tax=Paenibacillus xanthanilyticus TaxID=1783531 RepID=A0ABV8JXP1_9BACL
MTNRHIIHKLAQLGDRLDKPRDVHHWLYFHSAASRNQFKARVQQDGFQIVDQADQENKYRLRIARAETVELLAISDVTDFLVRTAEQHDGEYDGWETMVVKPGRFLSGLKRMLGRA